MADLRSEPLLTNYGVRPVSASGKPSGNAVNLRRPMSAVRPQELKSEYERSFGSFEKYAYKNGKWAPLRPTQGKDSKLWLEELIDNRKRAGENKARSRGDHFSRDHLLQIPSSATTFWEPPNFIESIEHLRSGRHENGMDTYRISACHNTEPASGLTTEEAAHANAARSRVDHLANILPSLTFPVGRSVSQSTQTLPEISQASSTPAHETHSDAVQADIDLDPVNDSVNRLEILRKAKYYDGKDAFAASLARLPRSSSVKSLHDGFQRSGSVSRRPLTPISGVTRSHTSTFSENAKTRNSEIDGVPAFRSSESHETKSGPKPYKEIQNRTRNGWRHEDAPSFTGTALLGSQPKHDVVKKIGGNNLSELPLSTKSGLSWTIPSPATKKLGQSRRSAVNSRAHCLRATEGAKAMTNSHAWTEL